MTESSLHRLAGSPSPGAERQVQQGDPPRETVLMLVAGVAAMGGLIHVGAAVDHFDEFPLYTVVFACMAATQIVWAGLILRSPSRRLLIFGGLFNVGVIGLWVMSRTVGVPIAPSAWVPESVGVADLIETAGEVVVVLAVWSVVMAEQVPSALYAVKRIAPLLVFTLFITALYGVGAHAG